MLRAGIYNRCSTEEEAQINALGIQASESREIVMSKGWTIAAQYIESQSGTTAYKRSEYQRLLDDLETDLFDIVVIKSIDRLTRSAKDWYLFLDKLTKHGKKLYIYIDNKFYTSDDSLLTGIKAILAEDFSRELSKKIKNAHRRRQEKRTGLNITVPIFGWDKISKDVYVLNEEEAEAYRLAFALAEEGKGFYSIANMMYDKGIRSKRGTRISEVQWRKMLYSPRAHGAVVLHTREYDFEAKRNVAVPENEWIVLEKALPPIVSREYQWKVLETLGKRSVKNSFTDYTRNMTKVGLYELSGKIYCSECNRPYYRSKLTVKKTTMAAWKCSTAIKQGRQTKEKNTGCNNIHVLEERVFKIIREACDKYYEVLFGKGDGIAEEALAVFRKVFYRENSEKELNRMEKELEKIEKKKLILSHKLVDEIISDEEFIPLHKELKNKSEELRNQISSIKKKEDEYIDYEDRLRKIRQALSSGIIDEARTKELITRVEKIVIYPDGKMQISFDKLKLISLLKIYNSNFDEKMIDEKFFELSAVYEK